MAFSKVLGVLFLSALVCVSGACTKKTDDAAKSADKSAGEQKAAAAKVLKFTAIPDNDETAVRERMRPLAEYLSEKLGVKFEYFHVADYAAAVKAMEKEDAFLGWYGGYTGLQVRRAVKGTAIAQGEEDKNFWSYIIAHKSTGLTEGPEFPKGIEGKTFTFGPASSTSGRLMPEHFIRQATGKKPDEVFSKVGFSTGHSNTIAIVSAGTWQVGAVNGKDWDLAVAGGKQGDAVAIWKTPTYMDYNWTIRGNIDEVFGQGFGEKLKTALLAIDPSKGGREEMIMKAFTRKRFIPAANDDYKVLESVATAIGLLK